MARRRHKRAHRNPKKAFKLFGMGFGTLALLGVGGFVLWKYVFNKPDGTVTNLVSLPRTVTLPPARPQN